MLKRSLKCVTLADFNATYVLISGDTALCSNELEP